MVESRIKKASLSPAKKTITASGIRIENERFVDDQGCIANRIIELLPKDIGDFKIIITINIAEDDTESR